MNAKHILTTLLIAPTVTTVLTNAQAQRPGARKVDNILQTETIKPEKPIHPNPVTADQIDKGYVKPAKLAPITKSTYKPGNKDEAAIEAHLNQFGYTLADPKNIWKEQPRSVNPSALNKQKLFNQTTPNHTVETKGYVVSDAFTKTFEAGNRDVLFAQAKFGLTHSGSQNLARLQGDAEINGAILGDFGNLARVTADFKAPRTGTQTASMDLIILGQSVWSKHRSGATASIADAVSYQGKLLDVGFDYTIEGFGIKAELWAEGSVSASFIGACTPNSVQVNVVAGGKLKVGGTVSGDFVIASAELNGSVVLADLKFSGDAKTDVSSEKGKLPQQAGQTIPIMTVGHHLKDDLTFGQGSAKIEIKAFGSTITDFTIFDEPNGLFQSQGNLESYDKVYNLPPILLNNPGNATVHTVSQSSGQSAPIRK